MSKAYKTNLFEEKTKLPKKTIYCIHCLLEGRETFWAPEDDYPNECPHCKMRTWRTDYTGVIAYIKNMRTEADAIEETFNKISQKNRRT